jgi:hypothetical protein
MHRPLGSSDQAPEAAQNLGPGRKEPNIIAFGDWQAVAFSIAFHLAPEIRDPSSDERCGCWDHAWQHFNPPFRNPPSWAGV